MTRLPSVTGDGVAESLRPLLAEMSETSFCQRTLPSVRERQRARSVPSFCWAVVKIRSPQTIGVPLLWPGMFADQRAWALSMVAGRSFADVEPLKLGPRHWGQLSSA